MALRRGQTVFLSIHYQKVDSAISCGGFEVKVVTSVMFESLKVSLRGEEEGPGSSPATSFTELKFHWMSPRGQS